MANKKFTDRRRSLVTEENSISDVLKLFMTQNLKLAKGITKNNIKDTWLKVMGPGVNNYTHSIQLSGNTVYVSLTSSIIRSELSYGKQKIVAMLNEEMGEKVIKDIVFR